MNIRRDLARAASRKPTARRTRELSADELREEIRRLRAELRWLEKDKRKVERDLKRLNAVLARQLERAQGCAGCRRRDKPVSGSSPPGTMLTISAPGRLDAARLTP